MRWMTGYDPLGGDGVEKRRNGRERPFLRSFI